MIIPAMSIIYDEISWWDISVVQVKQVIKLIQVMQVRLAQLWPDFWVIWYSTTKKFPATVRVPMPWIRSGRSKAGLWDRALCRIVILGQEVGPLMMMQIWWRLQSGNANDDIARPSPMQDCPFGTRGWCSNDGHILSWVAEMFVRRSHFGTKWQCPFGRTNFSKWAFPYFDLSQYFGNV